MATREDILARLEAINAGALSAMGFLSAIRNRGPLKNDSRPAVYLLDGDERGRDNNPGKNGRGNVPFRPQRTILSPEIWLVLEDRKKTEDTTFGTRMNVARDILCHRIATDAPLIALLGSPSEIIYRGCTTDLKAGSGLDGHMRLDFDFHYIFKP